MRIRVISVGHRAPGWVREATDDYLARLPADWRVDFVEVKPESRTGGGGAERWRSVEAQRIRAALPAAAHLVALDERGTDLDSGAFAARCARWRDEHRLPALLIGGPDGLDRTLLAESAERIRLSSLTLPHALVRVVLAEQLFRAWSILARHPYHRA